MKARLGRANAAHKTYGPALIRCVNERERDLSCSGCIGARFMYWNLSVHGYECNGSQPAFCACDSAVSVNPIDYSALKGFSKAWKAQLDQRLLN